MASLVPALAAGLFAIAASAAPIAIPNNDFSDAGNFGTIGGGLLGASGTNVPIGAGPWLGSYSGVLGLLAPPTLTIASGEASIDGLAAVNVLGILNNGGYFSQTLAQNYESGKRYTLTAVVDSGTVLDVGLLSGGNFGIALRSEGDTLASTATAPPQLIALEPLGGTSYELTLMFDSGDATTGPIDVQLFSLPQQLIGATLLTSVRFGTVELDGTAINPVSGSIVAVDPTPQSATVGEPFPNPLQVRVTDVDGDPVPGVEVTFTAPSSGASAVLSETVVLTDANGLASVDATANTIAGSYIVTASVEGVDTPASFNLTNEAGAAAVTVAATGNVQSAVVGQPFPEPLVVSVTDAFGNPVEGVEVMFDAPDSGATALFSADTVLTDANGVASVTATANDEVGSYEVTATVAGVSPPAHFELSNRLNDDGTTIGDGGGDEQQADIGGEFACALTVTVTDPQGAPAAGFAVDFVAPDTGASATLSNGVTSGSSVRALTNEDGQAIVSATANEVPGDYIVTASLVGSVGTVEFGLSNIEGLIFSDTFDTPCTPPMFP